MTHGAPDNYQVAQTGVNYFLQDDAELAARLGAISSIDRLGNVIWFDDFSNGKEAFYTSSTGTGAEIAISSLYFKHGGFSLKLKAGSTLDRWAQAVAYLTYPDPSRMGLEANFSLNSAVGEIAFILSGSTEISYFNTIIKLDMANSKFRYFGQDSNYHDIVTFTTIGVYAWHFHSLKFVADLTTGYYVGLIFDGVSYDLSGYQFDTGETAGYPALEAGVGLYSNEGVNGIAYLDSVIITRDEP